jgi:hypothetical protein
MSACVSPGDPYSNDRQRRSKFITTFGEFMRFSRSRNKEEIKRYVEENFVFGGEFALGLLISVLDMISSGIRHIKR